MNNIVFIDSRVTGYQTLVNGLKPGSEWFLIDGQSAGIEQIATLLRGRTAIDTLHIYSHGNEGTLFLGNTAVNSGNLGDYRSQLREIASSLTNSADILLYGCNVAAGVSGLQFINALADMTGADVAASNDITGAADLGGDWILEESAGTIDTTAAGAAGFRGTLSWYDTLSDATLRNLVTQDLTDNAFSYQEVLTLLNTASQSGITSNEFNDLTIFNQNAGNLYASDYLRYISNAVINGNPANQFWWGGCTSDSQKLIIGNLSSSGTSEYIARHLIDEWFLGRDLPIPSSEQSIYQYSGATGNLFVNGATANDINQGALGDCYLLASLGSIADSQTNYINDAFTDNGNGTYGVRFYFNGQAVYTTVNNQLPVSGGSLAFAGDSTGSLSGETWVALFEKAYVQVNAQYNFTTEQYRSNDYQVIEGGWAYPIREITNLPYRYYSAYYSSTSDPLAAGFNVSSDPSSYKNAIISALNQGAIAWLGSFGETSDSSGKRMFVSGHAFMILGYNESTDTFTIRNPWGGTGGTYLPEFQAHIEDFWNSRVKAVVAISDVPTNNVAPVLVHLTPQDNTTSIAPSANLVLEFSESVKAGTGNILIYNNDGTVAKTISVTDSSQVTFSGNTVIINPSSNLAASSSFYVNIGPAVIQDMSGSFFAGISGSTAYNFSTTTLDITPPILSSLSPADNATSVPVGSNIALTFNEAMAVGSGNILIYKGDGTLARAIAVTDSAQVSVSGNTVTLNPAADLAANSNYYINLGVGVLRDLAGNAFAGISGTTAYNFSTAASGSDDYADSVTDTTAPMGSLVVDGSATGTIETPGDHDLFRVNLTAGTAYRIELKGVGSGAGTLSDSYLRIRDSSGTLLAADDDSGTGTDSLLTFTPTASGNYYVDAAHYSSGIGTYRVSATRIVDTTAPILTGLSPIDNAVSVPVASNIVLTFSEAMAVGSGNILIYNFDGTLARAIAVTDSTQVSVSGNTVTLNPATDLAANSNYYINLGAGVLRDLAGNAFAGISGTTAYNFSTAASGSDDYADSVTDTTAPMGNLIVGGNATGTIETPGDHDLFRVNLAAGTAYRIELKGAGSGMGTLSDSYLRIRDSSGTELAADDDSGTGTDSLLTFTPTASGNYYVDAAHYSSGIGTYRVSATLVDTAAPTLSSLSPADNATNVAANSNIVFTFSEAMAVGSGNILIYNGDGSLARTIAVTDSSQVSVSGNTVSVNPATDLAASSNYYINLGAGVLRDLAGNAFAGISGTTAYNFSTATSGSDDYADSVTDSTAPMGSLVAGSSATGTIETPGDHDLFRVNLSAGTTYAIELKGTGSGAGTLSDCYLRLRDSSGTQLAYDDDSGAGLDSLLTFTPTSNGTYYIDAAHYSQSSSGLFSITGTYAVTLRTPTDTTAPVLTNLSPADNATEVPVDSNITLTFNEGVRGGVGNIYIYRNDGSLAQTIPVNDPGQVSFAENTILINPSTNLTESSGYYINIGNGVITDVFGNAFAGISGTTTYNFTTRSRDDYADSVTDTTAPMGSLVVDGSATGTIETPGDHDLFRVNLTAGTAYRIELKGAGSGAGTLSDSYLRIRDSSGTLLAADDDSGTGTDSLLTFTPTASGNYYVDAAHYSSGIGTYRVSATRIVDTTAPILTGLSPIDNAVSVPVASNIVLTFSEAMAVGSGNILIYNFDGTLARAIAVTDSTQVSVSGNTVTLNPATDLAANSNYYINLGAGVLRDLAGNAFAGISGTTAYNFSTAASGSDDYADSVTDTTAPMGNLIVGGNATGTIETPGDHDLFRVNLAAGTAYRIELKGAGSGMGTLSDSYLRIRDSSGTELAADDDSGTGTDSLLTFTPTASGNYYVDAAHYSSGIGTYRVSATLVDTAAPTLSSLSPADNATNVAANSNIVFTFSEAMAVGSGNILIYNGDGSLARTIAVTDSSQVSVIGNTVTVDPASDLSPGNNYYINLGAGVLRDLAGNAFAGISGTTAYNFTTADNDDYADSVTDSTASLGALVVGSNVAGTIETQGDHDLFRVNLTAGAVYLIELKGAGSGAGTLSDCYLRIRDSSGSELAYNDDGGTGLDSLLTFTPTASGNYYIDAAHYSSSIGTYRVCVSGHSGGTGNDTLNGTNGNDTLFGGDGNDVLDGGSGADSLAGGDGNDYYFVDNIGDLVVESNAGATGSTDIVYSALAAYTLSANVEIGRILSTGSANLSGNGLANVLFAGLGNNVLDGGAGTDTVSWQYGVSGGTGVTANLTTGTASGSGSGSGSDTLIGIEHLTGSANADSLTGDGNANVLDGGAGNDNLNGAGGNDTLLGGAGVDVLDGGVGADSLSGGDGNDYYFVDNIGDLVVESNAGATGGTDIVYSALAAYTLSANVEIGRILSTGSANLSGNGLANVLFAGRGNNVLDGSAGADTVSWQYGVSGGTGVTANLTTGTASGSGSDTLIGIEHLTGSANADSLTGDGNANTLDGGAGNDNLNGAGGNDTLLGGAGVDVLDGGSGADSIAGGDGNDYYFVDNIGDLVVENNVGATGGTDVVYSALAGYTLSANVEIGRILSTGAANLSGNGLANVLFAGLGNNVLDGSAGADTVSWQYGVSGGTGVTASLASGTASGSGSDTLIGIEHLTGSANADSLTGDGNANVLDGGAGNDTLAGGLGNDWLIGGSGADTFRFDTLPNGVSNRDTIVDFSVTDDSIALENAVFTALASGPLAAGAFRSGAGAIRAADADDLLIYDTTTGALYYDDAGNTGAGPVQIALIGSALALTSADFVVT